MKILIDFFQEYRNYKDRPEDNWFVNLKLVENEGEYHILSSEFSQLIGPYKDYTESENFVFNKKDEAIFAFLLRIRHFRESMENQILCESSIPEKDNKGIFADDYALTEKFNRQQENSQEFSCFHVMTFFDDEFENYVKELAQEKDYHLCLAEPKN